MFKSCRCCYFSHWSVSTSKTFSQRLRAAEYVEKFAEGEWFSISFINNYNFVFKRKDFMENKHFIIKEMCMLCNVMASIERRVILFFHGSTNLFMYSLLPSKNHTCRCSIINLSVQNTHKVYQAKPFTIILPSSDLSSDLFENSTNNLWFLSNQANVMINFTLKELKQCKRTDMLKLL